MRRPRAAVEVVHRPKLEALHSTVRALLPSNVHGLRIILGNVGRVSHAGSIVADDSKSIRAKVQSVWESFFPSSIYFVVFVWIALASFGFEHVAQLAQAGYFDNYQQS